MKIMFRVTSGLSNAHLTKSQFILDRFSSHLKRSRKNKLLLLFFFQFLILIFKLTRYFNVLEIFGLHHPFQQEVCIFVTSKWFHRIRRPQNDLEIKGFVV